MESAIYCRVSTEEQSRDGFSIRAQEQKLKEYAHVKDWTIFNIYIDEGISGKNITERPQINKMIADIKSGKVKNVLVFKLDRLTRNVGDLVFLMDLFKEHKCAFNSLTESIDTSTASGRMFIKIIGIFAEFERENIAERVRVGKERKTREGYSPSGAIDNYGYDREKGSRIQQINEAEAENVRLIFDMFTNQNMSLSAIAKSLNMQKIKGKLGCLWTGTTVRALLTNCNYIGLVRYAQRDPERFFEVEGKHEAIISEELFRKTQELIEKNTRFAPTKKPSEKNFLVGFLYCEKCGCKIVPRSSAYMTKNGKVKTQCFQCRTRNLGGECTTMNVISTRIETALIKYFTTFDDSFESDNSEIVTVETKNAESQIAKFRERLRHYDGMEKEVMSRYIGGEVTFENYRKMQEQLDSDRAFVNSEIAKLTATSGFSTEPTLPKEEIVATFCESWEGLTNAEKRQFLTNYVKRIILSNEPVEGSRSGDTKVVRVEFN